MRIISNNLIELKDGTKVELPETGRYVKLRIQTNESTERVFLNGKELKDGEFKVTFTAIFHYLFG